MEGRPYYRTVVVSDIHLGTSHSKVNQISDFLRRVDCGRLIMNGDIIDGWHLQKSGIPYGPWKSAEICQTRTSAQWTGIYGIGPTEGIRSKPLCDRFGLLFEISSQRHIGPSVTDPLRHRNRRMSYTNQLHHPSQYNAAKAR